MRYAIQPGASLARSPRAAMTGLRYPTRTRTSRIKGPACSQLHYAPRLIGTNGSALASSREMGVGPFLYQIESFLPKCHHLFHLASNGTLGGAVHYSRGATRRTPPCRFG